MRTVVISILFSVIFASWLPASAQNNPCIDRITPASERTPTKSPPNQDGLPPEQNAYLDKTADAARATLSVLVCEFRPHLSDRQRAIADRITLRVDRTDWQIANVRSRLDRQSGRRDVIFPIGFIMAVDMVDRGVIDQMMFRVPSQRLVDYTRRAADHVTRISPLIARGQMAPPMQPFCAFAGLNCQSPVYNSVEYGNMLAEVKLASFAVQLAHELAHHLLGHLEGYDRAPSVADEQAADRFALDLAMKINRPPLFALGSFGFFMAAEELGGGRSGSLDHPATGCRYILAVRESFRLMDGDAGFQRHLGATGQRTAYQMHKDVFGRFNQTTRGECR